MTGESISGSSCIYSFLTILAYYRNDGESFPPSSVLPGHIPIIHHLHTYLTDVFTSITSLHTAYTYTFSPPPPFAFLSSRLAREPRYACTHLYRVHIILLYINITYLTAF
jgi:hypothetical protein